MNTLIKLTIAAAAFSITPALADHTADHCGKSDQADGMRARVNTMNQQMDRIEFTEDHGKRQELMDLHEHMQEGIASCASARCRRLPHRAHELDDGVVMRHQQLSRWPVADEVILLALFGLFVASASSSEVARREARCH